MGHFGFSVWTTIEECLNPTVIWEKGENSSVQNNFQNRKYLISLRCKLTERELEILKLVYEKMNVSTRLEMVHFVNRAMLKDSEL